MTIISLGLLVGAVGGVGLALLGLAVNQPLISALGLVVFVASVAAALTIMVSCDPGCELGSGSGTFWGPTSR